MQRLLLQMPLGHRRGAREVLKKWPLLLPLVLLLLQAFLERAFVCRRNVHHGIVRAMGQYRRGGACGGREGHRRRCRCGRCCRRSEISITGLVLRSSSLRRVTRCPEITRLLLPRHGGQCSTGKTRRRGGGREGGGGGRRRRRGRGCQVNQIRKSQSPSLRQLRGPSQACLHDFRQG